MMNELRNFRRTKEEILHRGVRINAFKEEDITFVTPVAIDKKAIEKELLSLSVELRKAKEIRAYYRDKALACSTAKERVLGRNRMKEVMEQYGINKLMSRKEELRALLEE